MALWFGALLRMQFVRMAFENKLTKETECRTYVNLSNSIIQNMGIADGFSKGLCTKWIMGYGTCFLGIKLHPTLGTMICPLLGIPGKTLMCVYSISSRDWNIRAIWYCRRCMKKHCLMSIYWWLCKLKCTFIDVHYD